MVRIKLLHLEVLLDSSIRGHLHPVEEQLRAEYRPKIGEHPTHIARHSKSPDLSIGIGASSSGLSHDRPNQVNRIVSDFVGLSSLEQLSRVLSEDHIG